jgi:hypothetical protein
MTLEGECEYSFTLGHLSLPVAMQFAGLVLNDHFTVLWYACYIGPLKALYRLFISSISYPYLGAVKDHSGY